MRIPVARGTVAVAVQGTGDPVVAIHGGIFVSSLDPLTRLLAREFRVITYDRLGYGESTAAPSPYSLREQSRDVIAVMDDLNLASAHLVAYSFGGSIALEVAAEAPERIRSIVLLEGGPIHQVPAGEELIGNLRSLAELSRTGATRDALIALLVGSIGPNYWEMLDIAFPAGWFERAVQDAATFFEIELPATASWLFDTIAARSITTPVFSLRGSETHAAYAEVHEWNLTHLPNSSGAVLPGLNHSLQCVSATAVAGPVLGFLRSHLQ